MILRFVDGKTLEVNQAEEHCITRDNYVTLNIYSKDFTKTIGDLSAMLTVENIKNIQVIKNDGTVLDTLTTYAHILSIRKSITEFDCGYHIILADKNYKAENN